MTEVCIRRHANPKIARAIQSAIQKITDQKQCPTIERLSRATLVDGLKIPKNELENQLTLAMKDGLVIKAQTSSNHGKTKGKIQIAYRIASISKFEEDNENDRVHDWYCWECHTEGEVMLCSTCIRVFHRKCANVPMIETSGKFVCPVCKEIQACKRYNKKELDNFYLMMSFIITRMKEKGDEVHLPLSSCKYPTAQLFIKSDMCLKKLEERVAAREFQNFTHFKSDAKWLMHNFIVYFGVNSVMYAAANRAVEDANHEIEQIMICPDCYMMSNKRPDNWFSIPCKKKHPICYAKIGNDPPWPAKILQISEDSSSYDVRFFGPPHQRAWVSSKNVCSLDWKPNIKKRTKGWEEAEKELSEHLRLLDVMNNKELLQANIEKEKTDRPIKVKEEKTCAKKKQPKKKIRLSATGLEGTKPTQEASTSTVKSIHNNNNINQMVQNKNGFVDNKTEKVISDLQSTIKQLQSSLDKAKLDILKEKKSVVEKSQEFTTLQGENSELLKTKNELSNLVESLQSEISTKTSEIQNNKLESDEKIQELEGKCTAQSMEYENKRRLDMQEWEQKFQTTEQEFSRQLAITKQEYDVKLSAVVDDTARKVKSETEELSKQFVIENLRRAQMEADRLVCEAVTASKKKSWCANCLSEAFYHCCWNTNYCSTDCQRIHWVSHRYQCTREQMNTCRSCQQRQTNFPPINAFPHHLQQK